MKKVGVVYNWDISVSKEDQHRVDVVFNVLTSDKEGNIVKLMEAIGDDSIIYRLLESIEEGYVPTKKDLIWYLKECDLRIIGVK
jgi:hypothetical protein